MSYSIRGKGRNRRLLRWYKRVGDPFFLKKGFSSLTILFFGVTGALPTLPLDPPSESSVTEQIPEEKPGEVDPSELCQWQKDFSFFNRLQNNRFTPVEDERSEACPEKKETLISSPFTNTEVTSKQDNSLQIRIASLTAGYPVESMAPAIAEYDREVAALIVGIAKKESNWGKRVPVDATGADCFNYWGWKGAGARGVAMGHGCFGSPEEAVQAVGNRIAQLVELRKTSEPKNMIIWKCGSSCATHSPESVRKWIADVDLYYRKIVKN